MDPIRSLLTLIQTHASDMPAELEKAVSDFMKRFALVPRHEYEAHLSLLKTLEQQVADLEARLDALNDES